MEFAVEFATFCNICFRNEGLRKIQESDHLLNTLTVLIENKVIIHRHEIYLCLNCCEKLESYDQFKDMCLRNFLDFRVEYFALKKELEICNNLNIEKKLRNFIESKIYDTSAPFYIYDSERSAQLGNNVACTQSSDKRTVEKQDKEIDLKLVDFYNVACKTEKKDSEYKKEYKLHTESDIENSDGDSELHVTNEYFKVETCAEDTDENESSIKNGNRQSSPSTEEFGEEKNLKEHQVTHTGEIRYSCDVCNKTYSQLGSLRTHQRVHTGIKPHICNICNKAFALSTRLKNHMLIHTGDKPHTCLICNKDFRSSANLRRHERVHTGEKPYACSMCDKTFTGSGNLKVHERVHTGEKPYACRGCDKTFNHINNLKEHERLHTGEKPYECTVCNERFAQISSFKVHKLSHTGEKPHTCGVCKKTFAQTSTLKDHERIHTGVKPYSCEICKKTFRRLSHLREHERIHTGVKPYSCNICKKSFRHSGQCRLHEQKACLKQEVENTLTE